MSTGLLFDCDEQAAAFVFKISRTMKYDRALGLMDENGIMIGAVLFHGWNGFNVELSYYGQNTLTPGVVRCLARFAICTFNPVRGTVITSKWNKRLMQSLSRLGFRLEGIQRRYYGNRDCNRNTGVRFVIFNEQIRAIGKLEPAIEAKSQC